MEYPTYFLKGLEATPASTLMLSQALHPLIHLSLTNTRSKNSRESHLCAETINDAIKH